MENESNDQPTASRAHKKSKHGCKTCKHRKIKCDEAHPLCTNCRIYYQGQRLECDYELVTTSTSTPQKSTSSSRTANQRKKRDGKRRRDSDVSAGPSSSTALRDRYHNTFELSPGRAVSPHMLDPFATHPSTPELDADTLLQHYFQATVYTMFPFYPSATINPQADFYSPLIYTDALLYHVTLQLSCLHLEKLTRSRKKMQSKTLMGECLRLLREKVEATAVQPGGQHVTDETIAGVAGLLGIEHERGNIRMVQTHMSGLNKMLHLRGGLNAVRRSNGMIANIVFCVFAAANEEPFPSIDLTNPIPRPDWYLLAAPLFDQHPYVSFEAYGVPSHYASVLYDIRILAGTYQQASDCSSSTHYLSVLVYLTATLQRAMSLPSVAASHSQDRNQAYLLAEAVRASLIIHVFHQWCGLHQPDPSLLVSNARQNLKSALKALVVPGGANPLLLWFACVGAVGSPEASPERCWFRGHVAYLAGELGLESFEDLRRCLRGVVWHELQDGPSHGVLWDEVCEIGFGV